MASPVNRHCDNCIGTLSFPIASICPCVSAYLLKTELLSVTVNVSVTELMTNLDTLITTLEPVTSSLPASAGVNGDENDVTVTSPVGDDKAKKKKKKARKSSSRKREETDEDVTTEAVGKGFPFNLSNRKRIAENFQ